MFMKKDLFSSQIGIPANEMFRENKYSENKAKFRENAKCENIANIFFAKCDNFEEKKFRENHKCISCNCN